MKHFGLTRALVACAALAFHGCGSPAAEVATTAPGSGNAGEDLIGGVSASSSKLNAVGALGMLNERDEFEMFCTGTLIGPTTVLTAKHCAIVLDGALAGMKLVNLVPVYFAVGPDSKAPVRVVEAIAADLSPVNRGGLVGLGNDVAVYHLSEAVTDVTPIPFSSTELTEDNVGAKYISIGYGSQDNYEDLSGELLGTRIMGTGTLRALSGSYLGHIYGSFDAFVEYMTDVYGEGEVATNMELLEEWYAESMIPGYESWVGGAEGDAQTCHGDSGGPLLKKVDGETRIFGVVSGGYSSAQLTCDYGTFYASIGPRTVRMLDAALQYTDPCGGLSATGVCEGDVARRCTDKWEGDRRLSAVDCSEVGLTCGEGDNGRVGCVDDEGRGEGRPGPRARGIGPNGERAPSAKEVRAAVFQYSRGSFGAEVRSRLGQP